MAGIALPVDGDGEDQLRVTFPHSDDKIILGPFERDGSEDVTNHEFHLPEDLHSALLSRSDLDLEFKHYFGYQEKSWWPYEVNVNVNNTPMTIEGGYQMPLYLKTVCRPGRNVIQITGDPDYLYKRFILRLVYRPSVRSVIDILLKKRLVPPPDCIARLNQCFATMGLETTTVNVSLKCPLTQQIITVPARGDKCEHIQCFDLKSFLKRVAKRKRSAYDVLRCMACPVCSRGVTLDLLQVDQYMLGILTSLKSTSIEDIVIYRNAQWSGVTKTGEIVNYPNDDNTSTLVDYEAVDDGEPFPNEIRFTISIKGGCVAIPGGSAFLIFPPDAVVPPVTFTCRRISHKECSVTPRERETFCSKIIDIGPQDFNFKEPVTVLLPHSAVDEGAYADYYDLSVQILNDGCKDITTERLTKCEELPKEINSKIGDREKYLPVAKASIVKTCTLVVAARIHSENIVVQPTEACVFSKSYGEESKLKIDFPAGAVEAQCCLEVQLFPANEILDTWLNKDLVHPPIIRVSGRETPFLKPVDVELVYSGDDVRDINKEFFPIGAKLPFSSKHGVMLRSQKKSQNWRSVKDDVIAQMERIEKDCLKVTFSTLHFCKRCASIKKNEEADVENMEQKSSNFISSTPQVHKGIVLAVHDTSTKPTRLSAILAPKNDQDTLEKKYGFGGKFLQKLLSNEQKVYFCVPFGEQDREHLSLPNDVVRFFPGEITDMSNDINDKMDLSGKSKHFLMERCDGENHSGDHVFARVLIKRLLNGGNASIEFTPALSVSKRDSPNENADRGSEASTSRASTEVGDKTIELPGIAWRMFCVLYEIVRYILSTLPSFKGTSNSCDPPDISVTILELKDLNPPFKFLECVQLPIVDVLLLVVEDDALLSSYSFLSDTFKSRTTELGVVYFGVTGDGQNKVNISLVRCSKGSIQVDAAHNVARTAIKTLKPKAVFSVGCCCGLNRTKAKLGDVVISAKLSTFGDKKVIHDRRQWDGRILDVSRKFGSLIKSAADGWKAPLKNPDAQNVIVHRDAEILTGVEVVDSSQECKRLCGQFPDAIAIEQEGQGVYSASFDRQLEWVIIKGISHFADGGEPDAKWRRFSSVMAASVVFNILKQPDVLKGWNHYQEIG